jgi:hypothetical protein
MSRMKPRYNLRMQPTKLVSPTNKLPSSQMFVLITLKSTNLSLFFSSAKKPKLRQSAAIKAKQNRRHSLRLNSIIKPRPIIRETRRNQ